MIEIHNENHRPVSGLTIPLSQIDVKVRANVATELRDSIEPLCSGASYPIFLAKLWPVFKTILKGDPVFFSMSYDQVRFFGTSLPSVNVARNGLTTLVIH